MKGLPPRWRDQSPLSSDAGPGASHLSADRAKTRSGLRQEPRRPVTHCMQVWSYGKVWQDPVTHALDDVNTLRPRQNGRHFVDDISRCIFVKFCILIKISLKFVPMSPINNIPALVLDNGSAPNRRQAIIWTDADPIHWRIYVSLGGDELTLTSWMKKKTQWKCIYKFYVYPSTPQYPCQYFF